MHNCQNERGKFGIALVELTETITLKPTLNLEVNNIFPVLITQNYVNISSMSHLLYLLTLLTLPSRK